MSAATAEAPVNETAAETKPVVKKNWEATRTIDNKIKQIYLGLLTKNAEQSRGKGVIESIVSKGYIAFPEDEVTDKKLAAKGPVPCVLTELLSDDAERQAAMCKLIEELDPELAELGNSFIRTGQLHPIGVRAIEDDETGKETGNLDVIFGARRTLAMAYRYAKSGGKFPPYVEAKIITGFETKDLLVMSLEENTRRKNESYIDQALHYQKLKKAGMKINDIAEVVGENPQNVRNRLQLLKLKKEEIQQVHEGKLPLVKALNILRVRNENPSEESTPAETPSENGDRRRMPTVKQGAHLFFLTEKPENMAADEWAIISDEGARKLLAYYCNIEGGYRTLQQVKQEQEAAAAVKKAEQEEAEAKKKEAEAKK